ncbi:hypothetical protein ABIB17_002867 [Arthrobacter sp. UYEF6]
MLSEPDEPLGDTLLLPPTHSDADYLVQERTAGLVRVKRDGGRLAFAAPPLTRSGGSWRRCLGGRQFDHLHPRHGGAVEPVE